MGRLRIDRLAGPAAPLVGARGVIAARCHLAASPMARLVGLLATPDMRVDEAVWFPRCRGVHALGLRAPIGVALLDRDGRVLRVVDPLPRGRAAWARGAAAVVECRAGVLAGLAPGEALRRHEIPATSGSRVPTGGRYP